MGYNQTAVRNLTLFNKASEVIREFNQKNIEFLVLKGLYLAFDIYPSMGLRPMTDVDFLIKREDLDRIEEILFQLGYYDVSPKAQRSYGCDVTFCNKDGIFIDIHWDLCQYERFKGIINITPDFWKKAREFNLEGMCLQTLSIENHILYISLHYGLFDLLKKGNGIGDLFYLINTQTAINWQKIIDNAADYGIKIPLYYSLLKVSQRSTLKLPDFVLENLRPPFFKKVLLDYMIFRHYNALSHYLAQALMVGNFLDTLKILGRLIKGLRRAYKRRRPKNV